MLGIALPYCRRCDRLFPHEKALQQHLWNSSAHAMCPECRADGASPWDLIAHYRMSGCRYVCLGCNGGSGKGWIKDSPAYWEHVSNEHVCPWEECGKHFSSDSHLQHHLITHRSPNVSCYGCDRKFTTYGGMIIHLEAGTCDSGIDILDLNKSAALEYRWRKWTNKDCLNALRNQLVLGPGVSAFKCPTCEVRLPKLSSLFMHVASASCSQTLNYGPIKKLRRWLWKRHHRGYRGA